MRRNGFKRLSLLSRCVFMSGYVLFCFILTGCATLNSKIVEANRVAQIEVGKSTRDDVLALLGLPHKREVKSQQEGQTREYWIYFKGRGDSFTRWYVVPLGVYPVAETSRYILKVIPIWGLPISDKEAEKVGAIIVFDEKGVVVDSVRGGGKEE